MKQIEVRAIDRRAACMALACVFLGATCAFSAALADSLPTLDSLKQKMPDLERWLRESGLDQAIEIVRLHRSGHPQQDELSLIHLETRWKRPIQSRERAVAEFAAFATTFLQVSGHSVQHKLLFKFSQLCGIPLPLAAVHINVVDMDVAAYIAVGGEPATDVSGLRMARVNATIPAEPPSATLNGGKVPDSDSVMRLLERRFAARQGKFVRDPVFPGIVPFRVDNLRGEIVSDSRLWEKLEGTLFMNSAGDKVLLFLEMGGQYAAAGLGNVPPNADAFRDLEPRYAKQLATYSSHLLQELQGSLGELIR
jgi:hypothetical protein